MCLARLVETDVGDHEHARDHRGPFHGSHLEATRARSTTRPQGPFGPIAYQPSWPPGVPARAPSHEPRALGPARVTAVIVPQCFLEPAFPVVDNPTGLRVVGREARPDDLRMGADARVDPTD